MANLITTEQVSKYHPDKFADQISDAILDECLHFDKNARVAVETLVKDTTCVIAGEITLKKGVIIAYDKIVHKVARKLNYTIDKVINLIGQQSPQIAIGVDNGGAGDQGMMTGYATRETESRLPFGFDLANKIIRRIEQNVGGYLKGDAKTQVTVDQDTSEIIFVVVSVCHNEKISLDRVRDYVKALLYDLVPSDVLLVNPAGEWTVGGPIADAGLCLVGDTLITMENGDLKQIQDVVIGDKVIGINRKKGVVTNKVNNGIKSTFQVSTKSTKIVATENHPFLVNKQGVLEWVLLKDLKEKDELVIPKTRVLNKNTIFDVDAYLLGYFIGNGNYTAPDRINVYFNPLRKEALGKLLMSSKYQKYVKYYDCSPDRYVLLLNREMKNWIKENGIVVGTASQKRIPMVVWSFDEHKKRSFVAGLFDSDGHIGKPSISKGRSIERSLVGYTSTSEKLIDDLSILLKNLGFSSTTIYMNNNSKKPSHSKKDGTIINNNHDSFFINITDGEYRDLFNKIIPLQLKKDDVIETGEKHKHSYKIFTLLENLKALNGSIFKKVNVYCNYYAQKRNNNGIKEFVIRRILQNYADYKDSTEYQAVLNMIDNYVFEPIVSITKQGDQNTFDISVNGTEHSFIANGIIVHNTGRKIVCDQYGGYLPVGGGAFSGKDPTKVDRSGAYMARRIAVELLDQFPDYIYKDIYVQLSYSIGIAKPVSVSVYGNSKHSDILTNYVLDNYDLTPQGIIDYLDLKNKNYEKLAEGCHYR